MAASTSLPSCLPPGWVLITTRAPSAANRSAMALPIPLPAPLTKATLSFNLIIFLSQWVVPTLGLRPKCERSQLGKVEGGGKGKTEMLKCWKAEGRTEDGEVSETG